MSWSASPISSGKMKMSWSASPISSARRLLVLKLAKPTGYVVFLLGFLLYLVSSEAQFVQTIIYEFLVVEYYNFWASLMEPAEVLLQSKNFLQFRGWDLKSAKLECHEKYFFSLATKLKCREI